LGKWFTPMCLSLSSITWYQPRGGDALRKVMTVYARWMTYSHLRADSLSACSPVHRDQSSISTNRKSTMRFPTSHE